VHEVNLMPPKSGKPKKVPAAPMRTPVDAYFDFEVLQEPWCRYRLSDGSVLRTRFVLLKMLRIQSTNPELPHSSTLASQTLVVLETSPEHRGPPGPPLTPQEIAAAPKTEVGFQILQEVPAIYRFEGDRKLVVNTRVTGVRRLPQFGPDGDSVYQVDSAAELGVMGGPIPSQVAPPSLSTQPRT
jgi:hypothetical protein